MAEQGRRRIDRVAAPDFLDGLDERSSEEILGMRDDCREEEARLSYTRRLLQARIDIARAEQARRRGDASGGLIESLPAILADDVSTRRSQPQARLAPVYVPGSGHDRRAEDRADAGLGQLPDLDDDELDELLRRTVGDERAVSDLRRRVLDHLDRLQDEIVARLKDGRMSTGDLGLQRGAHGRGA